MNELMKTTSSLGVILIILSYSFFLGGVPLGRPYPGNKSIMVSDDHF